MVKTVWWDARLGVGFWSGAGVVVGGEESLVASIE